MIITKISQQAKSEHRANVFVDGKFFVGLDKMVVMKLGLKPGMKVDPGLVKLIEQLSTRSNIWDYSLKLLSKTPKSIAGMRDKLRQRFPEEDIEGTISRLVEDGLLDDQRLSEMLINRYTREQQKSRIEALAHMVSKGIPQDIARPACSILDSEYELAVAKNLIEKRLRYKSSTKQEITKTSQYLARKGIGYGIVKKALDELGRNVEK